MSRTTVFNIALLWLTWVIIILSFQWIVTTRLEIQHPDRAVSWTESQTRPDSNEGKIYLLEPFMNRQVAWDSEYYVGIAVGGYDDPEAGTVINPETGNKVIKNYSFFPFYPYVMRIFALPLKLLGLENPLAAASLSGVIVSALGTLVGLLALWDLTRSHFEQEDAYRAVFYALIFPTSFFFAMVYTEGLFIGLAFGALALSKRGYWVWASILGLFATWTRAHGAALALPLLLFWLMEIKWREALKPQITWTWVLRGALALLPLAGYLVWRTSALGQGWAELQEFHFGRALMSIGGSIEAWKNAFDYAGSLGGGHGQIYFAIEAGSILLALIASVWLLRYDLAVALFSLAIVFLSVFSGSAGSMARYMLIVPALYIFLAQLGKNRTFDRSWTLFSILLLGMEASLFAEDMWVG
ncbi:MAG TPA: mannosyltransferase family protein [Anaerolineales bacterium]|nr:mannosyltransferase family protein [Anaerolineales bacterium]